MPGFTLHPSGKYSTFYFFNTSTWTVWRRASRLTSTDSHNSHDWSVHLDTFTTLHLFRVCTGTKCDALTSEPDEGMGLPENENRVVRSAVHCNSLVREPSSLPLPAGFVHHRVSVGSRTKAPWDSPRKDYQFSSWKHFLNVWTHESVHCCAQPGQLLIRVLLSSSPK